MEHRPRGRLASLRRIPLTNLQIILIALLVVGVRLVIDFSQRVVEGQRKLAEQRQLEETIAALIEERQLLESAKAYYSSTAYVETWAHDEGKMVREGETLVIPVYSQQVTASTPPLAPFVGERAETPLFWQIWWALFFDAPLPAPGS